jgi:hypothetical protein
MSQPSSKAKISSLAPGQAFTTTLTKRRGTVNSVVSYSDAVYVTFEDGESKGLHRCVIVEETAH